jgi:hypothetical protein
VFDARRSSGAEDNRNAAARQRDAADEIATDSRFPIPYSRIVDTQSGRTIAYVCEQVNYFTKSGA